MTRYDVVIVGGAVIGSAVAYYLAANPDFDGSVLVVERDPTYARSSTALSCASIRTQFSNALNGQVSQYGAEVIRDFGALMEVNGEQPNLNFHPAGYLFLAGDAAQAGILRANHATQISCGADVVLWDKSELARAFPYLRVDDVELASFGQSGEGWFDNTGLMAGFRNKAKSLGVTVVHDEVTAIQRAGDRVTGVTLKSGGAVGAGVVVNASGPRAARTARMAGLDIPVEPRKRTVFVFDCATPPKPASDVNGGLLPLVIDPSGVFFRPEGSYFLAGCAPAQDPAVDWDDFEPRHEEFDEIIWPVIAARSESFEAVKVVNHWAGHYDFNVLDHNMVVGRHPEVTNFIFANGFSGHGLQQGPATGRGVSELIVYGSYKSLDLSPVGYERIIENRPFLEQAVI